MANKQLFSSVGGLSLSRTNARNEAGGSAYAFSPRHELAQYAATGCLNNTYYTTAEEQFLEIANVALRSEPEFVAKAALYARAKGHMKDTPALLVGLLSLTSPGLMAEVFDRVIDTPRMLRTFVQIMRSGVLARKSLGTLPKRLVLQWLESRSDEEIFSASVGNAPSMADIVRMVHPKPTTRSREALYGYMLGRAYDHSAIPDIVRRYEAFKSSPQSAGADGMPDVPMAMLTSLSLTREQWARLAATASWQSLRMNLNTFLRHGVFDDSREVRRAANRLRDAAEISRARAFPNQLMAAFVNADHMMPREIREALEHAMEVSMSNVPEIAGKVWVLPDCSGSMHSPITGHRPGATSKVRCIDVAALFAAAIMHKNPRAEVLPFAEDVRHVGLNRRDTVMTNAERLAAVGGGGTDCSAPLAHLNRKRQQADVVIYISDNQSWIDSRDRPAHLRASRTMEEWRRLRKRNPGARLICLDLQPYGSTQAAESEEILNVGGFSDAVFDVISRFCTGNINPDHWVGEVEKEVL